MKNRFIWILIGFLISVLFYAPAKSGEHKYGWNTNHIQFIGTSLNLLISKSLLRLPKGETIGTIWSWLDEGNEYEDTDLFDEVFRWCHHFCDYITGEGYLGDSGALDWALNQNQPDRNWNTAIEEFRAGHYDLAYTYLGQVLHLLQDMGVPSHTRNDGHGPGMGDDSYEKYCDIKSVVSIMGLNPVAASDLATLFSDLAYFTGSNHVSNDTIFTDYSSPSIQNCDSVRTGNLLYYKDRTRGIFIAARWIIGKFFLDEEVCKGYWKDISPKVVEYGAGLLKLFQDKCFPKIESLSPTSGAEGTIIRITGSNFGENSDGSGQVTFNDIEAETISWSDTRVECKVPAGATTGPVVVTVHRAESNAVDFLIEMEFIKIPTGDFIMGSMTGEGDPDEIPQHTVYLDAYEIGKYEVMNSQFAAFVAASGYQAQQDWRNAGGCLSGYSTNYPNNPVVCVTWYDAVAFCDYYGYRLPTEAEWEKAAGGTDARIYPWGNTWDPNLCNNWQGPNFIGMAPMYECGGKITGTFPVGVFDGTNYPALNGVSPYGCMDMSGNVYEWCNDWFAWNYYTNSPYINPLGPVNGSCRVFRGGSWYQGGFRCAERAAGDPEYYGCFIGFRVCR